MKYKFMDGVHTPAFLVFLQHSNLHLLSLVGYEAEFRHHGWGVVTLLIVP